MDAHKVVAREEWTTARKALLEREKALTRLRDELSEARRNLPWVKIDKVYSFDGPEGAVRLAEVFDGCSQLIVYHFMFGPDWESGCKSCAFWSDHFDAAIPHLKARDTALAVISRAPLAKLSAFAQRLEWRFLWLSSLGSDFNTDYGVSFDVDDIKAGRATYNYGPLSAEFEERGGVSVFSRTATGDVYHTYSSYARGLEAFNSTYQLLDLTPKGRDEDALNNTMEWVRLHDKYDH